MPYDPIRVQETRAWLLRALHDLRAAELLLKGEAALPDVAVFHCQQAAEKALKAYLFWHDVPFRKTHDIEQLGQSCSVRDPSLSSLMGRAIDLTPYAWRFRYPGEMEVPPVKDVDQALRLARAVYEAIVQRLPTDVRP